MDQLPILVGEVSRKILNDNGESFRILLVYLVDNCTQDEETLLIYQVPFGSLYLKNSDACHVNPRVR